MKHFNFSYENAISVFSLMEKGSFLWVRSDTRLKSKCLLFCNVLVTNMYHNRRRQWHPTPVVLPGNSHGWRSLAGCSPWSRKALDTTERLHFHFSLSCIGEGNGNPFQCSCLENPSDGGAWWAAIYGVAQGQTWLKWLSSSMYHNKLCFTGLSKFILYIKSYTLFVRAYNYSPVFWKWINVSVL